MCSGGIGDDFFPIAIDFGGMLGGQHMFAYHMDWNSESRVVGGW